MILQLFDSHQTLSDDSSNSCVISLTFGKKTMSCCHSHFMMMQGQLSNNRSGNPWQTLRVFSWAKEKKINYSRPLSFTPAHIYLGKIGCQSLLSDSLFSHFCVFKYYSSDFNVLSTKRMTQLLLAEHTDFRRREKT